MIDVLATAPHYADHVGAVYGALPEDARGRFMASGVTAVRVRELGFDPAPPEASAEPILVAAYGDLQAATRLGRDRIAIMEHGAGQSYAPHSEHGSYAGGLGRGAASLFLHPGPHPAARDRRAYPRARVEVIGSPHLDALPTKATKGRTVAFTFHFNAPICAETRTAYSSFFPAVLRLADRYEVLGHGHPRLWAQGNPGHRLADRYRMLGIEPVQSFDEVCRRADVLIFDNTSAGFAFAATGRPVVVLNSPAYDRRVNHGLRFWEAAGVGVNCDRPEALGECIEEALRDTPEQRAKREAALDMVYAYRSGARKRGADALMEWIA